MEKDTMADNEATRDLFRELLGMTDGGTTGGRGPMHIPADIMDSLAGDAAQDALARESLIMEMRKAEARAHDPRFVSLDLMEMEATDVDSFLSGARKKIIKRSKPTRKACCAKIGGVLDQIMGPAGGSENGNLELQGVRDRGKMDPIGDVDQIAEGDEEGVPLKLGSSDHETLMSVHGGQGCPVYALGSRLTGRRKTMAKPHELRAAVDALRKHGDSEEHENLADFLEGGLHGHHEESVDSDLMRTMTPEDGKRFAAEMRQRRAAAAKAAAHGMSPAELHSRNKPEIEHPRSVKRNPMDARGPSMWQKSSVDVDLLDFIAEEFFHYEHDNDCPLADPNFGYDNSMLGEAEKFIQKAIKKPGALRAHYGAGEGDEIPMAKARADYKRLSKKAEGEGTLTGDEMKLFKRLQLFLKVLKPASQQEDHYEDYPMEPSKTALALSSFMESSHNAYAAAHSGSGRGSPGSLLRKQDYAGDMSRAERDDNKDYPTDLMPAKSGGNKTAGAPGKLSTRDKDAGDPIGEAVATAAPAPEYGRDDDEGPSGTIPGPRKKGMPGKPKMPATGGTNRVSRFMTQAAPTNRVSGRSGDNYPSAGSLNRMFKASGQRPDMQDVDYDGPVISETAMALANFMEASSQAADAKSKLALGKGDAGDLSLAKRNDPRENLGGPLQKFGSMRGGLDVYDDGGKKARFDKGANPIGGAVPGEQSAKRMKK